MQLFSGSPAEATTEAQTREQAYTAIVNEHIDEIYNFARYMLSDSDEADDIVQKTFLSFYDNMAKLDLSGSIRPWLYKVARNKCLDYIKKKKAINFSVIEPDVVMDIPEHVPSLEAKLDTQELLDTVKKEIAGLPPQYREVMLLKYFEDMTFEQISESLEISPNTAKSHFYRGKALLFAALPEQA